MRRSAVLSFDLKTAAMQTTVLLEYVKNWAELTAIAREKTK
jgi:hypothetical protein